MKSRKGELTILVAVLLTMVLLVAAAVLMMVLAIRHVSEMPQPVAAPRSASALKKQSPPSASSPTERPAWVDEQPGLTGNVYHETIEVGPYTTRDECNEALLPALRTAMAAYTDRLCGQSLSGQVTIADAELRRDVLRETWQETVDTSVGPMQKLYGRLQFDERLRGRVEQLCRWVAVETRLRWVGTVTAAILLLLGGSHLWLRRGRPSAELQGAGASGR
ncbi:MAG TPA: hypothetical protein VG713_07135 [Pirellulales bacterium]|nr:hypothetical protein [Pirellulales bacterium]